LIGADPGGSSGMDAMPWNPDDRCGGSPVGRRKPLAERPGVDAPRPCRVDHHVASPLRCCRLSVCAEPSVALNDSGGGPSTRRPCASGGATWLREVVARRRGWRPAGWAWTRSRRGAQLLTLAVAPENPLDTRGLMVAASPKSPPKDEESPIFGICRFEHVHQICLFSGARNRMSARAMTLCPGFELGGQASCGPFGVTVAEVVAAEIAVGQPTARRGCCSDSRSTVIDALEEAALRRDPHQGQLPPSPIPAAQTPNRPGPHTAMYSTLHARRLLAHVHHRRDCGGTTAQSPSTAARAGAPADRAVATGRPDTARERAAENPAASSTTDAMTNWVQDASYAACSDLT
jgi:hypothetical protein